MMVMMVKYTQEEGEGVFSSVNNENAAFLLPLCVVRDSTVL